MRRLYPFDRSTRALVPVTLPFMIARSASNAAEAWLSMTASAADRKFNRNRAYARKNVRSGESDSRLEISRLRSNLRCDARQSVGPSSPRIARFTAAFRESFDAPVTRV